ncbi:MAG: nucleotide sugar dehydrogenase, partial [Mycobacteriaceae bacterium]
MSADNPAEVALVDLVVVGQGYVGLPLALLAAERGLSVVGLDTNAGTVEALRAGRSHVDDISESDLAAALAAGYTATTDTRVLASAAVIVVCVPTPLGDDGGPDLRHVQSAAAMIGKHVRPGALVVLESTTYPGTTDEVFAPLVLGEGRAAGRDLYIAFSPERIDPGNPSWGVRNTPKVVGGMTAACTAAAVAFYSRVVDTVVPAKGTKEAEMAKLLENT